MRTRAFPSGLCSGSKARAWGEELRAELVGLVRLEVLRQRAEDGGGLLVVASKAVVARLFADAGRPAPALGAVVLVGREELPPEALAGQARALFGDGAEPLALPEPDGSGAVLPPEAALPVLMADGSARALVGRAYAEPRLRALQMQHREHGLRQAAERLRLAHADSPKRVLVLSRVPVPGLPVAELLAWADLAPSRFARAVAEAAHRSGILRTSGAGVAADAPETFPSVKAAEHWLAKEGADAVKYPRHGSHASPTRTANAPSGAVRWPSERAGSPPAGRSRARPLGSLRDAGKPPGALRAPPCGA